MNAGVTNKGRILFYAVNRGDKGETGAAGEAEAEEGRTKGEGCKDTGHKSIKTQASLIPALTEQLVFQGGSHFTIRSHCAILNKKPTFHYQEPILALFMSVRLNLRCLAITWNWTQNNTEVLLIASHQLLAVSCLSTDSLESIQFSYTVPNRVKFQRGYWLWLDI